ncbi:hypothetical protein PR003_g612 [Phytophthora rubi]|uniref:Uncharacterized protein n=1 Tax=Phytophthora rubi TaxID=129364 RepID=A0A6A3NWR8_9STRA|nr:hypothetical protein PR002_g76 [Phytophthora rubi]KAE9359653.1 hypothetical protein PR003_g612 [Phytophthora rubi]
MCSGGTRTQCSSSERTHVWNSPLPTALQEYITELFGTSSGSCHLQ